MSWGTEASKSYFVEDNMIKSMTKRGSVYLSIGLRSGMEQLVPIDAVSVGHV